MSRRVLITGTHDTLAFELATKLRNQGVEVQLALPDREERSVDTGEDVIRWNPCSALSARSVLTEVRRRVEHLDDAYVLCAAASAGSSFHEPAAVSLQEYVDTYLSGPAILMKELLQFFLHEGHGSILLHHHIPGGVYETPLYSVVQAGLERLGEELFRAYAESPVSVQGFRSADTDTSAQAEALATEVSAGRTSVKWTRLGPRSGIFPFRG